MIERNRAPYGKVGNFVFGLAEILDGIIRVASLGFFHGKHRFTPMNVVKAQMLALLARRKKAEKGDGST